MRILRFAVFALLLSGCASSTPETESEEKPEIAQAGPKKKCVKKPVLGSKLTKTVCEGDAPDPTIVEVEGKTMERELRNRPRPTDRK